MALQTKSVLSEVSGKINFSSWNRMEMTPKHKLGNFKIKNGKDIQ